MILRKYLAWMGSTLVLIGLGSFILPEGFSQIADWFGPVLGPAFRPELHLFFLLAGPSLMYTPLLATWVAAGFVGGFFARGILRSMAAGTMSIVTIVLLLLGNGLLMFDGIQNLTSGVSGFSLPPPPAGLSIADILNAPIVAQMIEGATAGGGLFSILSVLVFNLIVNIVLYAVVFTMSGFLFSALFRGRRSQEFVGPPAIQSPAMVTRRGTTVLASVVLLLLLSSVVVPVGVAQGPGLPEEFAGEQLFLDLQRDGSLTMVYATNVSSLPGVPTDFQREEFQNLVAGFLFAFNGTIEVGPENPFSFILQLLPENGFLVAYQVSDPSVGRARADLLASEFGQGFGVNLRSIVNFDLTSFGGQQIPGGGIHLGIYEGDGSPRDVGSSVLAVVQSNGVGSILTPEKVFVNQYGVLAGFVNFNFENATVTPSAVVAILADLTPLGNFFGRGTFTLGLREVFGSGGTIEPSAEAKTTNIRLSFPPNSTVTGWGPTFLTPNATIGELEFSMNSTDSPVSNVFVTFDGVFPQRIEINRQLDPQPPFASGTTVIERITVRNLGNETIQGLTISEKRLFDTYPTLQLLSSSYNATLGDVPPQGSAEASLQFRVLSDGVYTLRPVEASYFDQGDIVRKSGTRAFMESSFNLLLYLEQLVGRTAPYSYVLLGLVALPPVLQLRKLGGRPKTRVPPVTESDVPR